MTFEQFATAFQAFGPTIVSLIVGGITVRLTYYFGHSQKQLAEEKLRREFYERKYKLWQGTQQLGQLLASNDSISNLRDYRTQANNLVLQIQEYVFLIEDKNLRDLLAAFEEKTKRVLAGVLQYRNLLQQQLSDTQKEPYTGFFLECNTFMDDCKILTQAFSKVLRMSDLTQSKSSRAKY